VPDSVLIHFSRQRTFATLGDAKEAYSEMNTAIDYQMIGEHPTKKLWDECPF
jgi:hypothetical protein